MDRLKLKAQKYNHLNSEGYFKRSLRTATGSGTPMSKNSPHSTMRS